MLLFPTSQKKYPSIQKETVLETNYLNLAQTAERTPIKKFKSNLAIGGGPHSRHE